MQTIVGQITNFGGFCGVSNLQTEVHKLGNSFNVLRSNLHKNILKYFLRVVCALLLEFGVKNQEITKQISLKYFLFTIPMSKNYKVSLTQFSLPFLK